MQIPSGKTSDRRILHPLIRKRGSLGPVVAWTVVQISPVCTPHRPIATARVTTPNGGYGRCPVGRRVSAGSGGRGSGPGRRGEDGVGLLRLRRIGAGPPAAPQCRLRPAPSTQLALSWRCDFPAIGK